MTIDTEQDTSPVELADTIGSRLKAFRNGQKISVKQLAMSAGVSVGMISQIERNLSSPSIKILLKICHALNIPLASVLGSGTAENNSSSVVRKKERRPRMILRKGAVVKEILSPAGDYDIQFMIISMAPHSIQPDVVIGPGEKAGLILEGVLTLNISDASYKLSEGDSFQFSSQSHHMLRNDEDQQCKVMWIMNTKDLF